MRCSGFPGVLSTPFPASNSFNEIFLKTFRLVGFCVLVSRLAFRKVILKMGELPPISTIHPRLNLNRMYWEEQRLQQQWREQQLLQIALSDVSTILLNVA